MNFYQQLQQQQHLYQQQQTQLQQTHDPNTNNTVIRHNDATYCEHDEGTEPSYATGRIEESLYNPNQTRSFQPQYPSYQTAQEQRHAYELTSFAFQYDANNNNDNTHDEQFPPSSQFSSEPPAYPSHPTPYDSPVTQHYSSQHSQHSDPNRAYHSNEDIQFYNTQGNSIPLYSGTSPTNRLASQRTMLPPSPLTITADGSEQSGVHYPIPQSYGTPTTTPTASKLPSAVELFLSNANLEFTRRRSLSDPTSGATRTSSSTDKGKKKRCCTRWTEEENKRLIDAFVLYEGKNWSSIAKYVGNKTSDQCNQHWHRVLNPAISKKPWGEEEDLVLMRRVKDYGESSWKKISEGLIGRTDLQCRHRWTQLKKTMSPKVGSTSPELPPDSPTRRSIAKTSPRSSPYSSPRRRNSLTKRKSFQPSPITNDNPVETYAPPTEKSDASVTEPVQLIPYGEYYNNQVTHSAIQPSAYEKSSIDHADERYSINQPFDINSMNNPNLQLSNISVQYTHMESGYVGMTSDYAHNPSPSTPSVSQLSLDGSSHQDYMLHSTEEYEDPKTYPTNDNHIGIQGTYYSGFELFHPRPEEHGTSLPSISYITNVGCDGTEEDQYMNNNQFDYND